jgi:peroxiredoxin
MVDQVEFESAAYHDGETQRFSFNGEGLTVLAFFPGAFTGACTEEMCNFRDSMSDFNEMDTEVIGISVDTPFALEEFAKQNELNFTLVSDTSKDISRNYDVDTVMPGLEYEIANRAVFLVKDGEVIYEERMEDPTNLPDMERLKEEIREA